MAVKIKSLKEIYVELRARRYYDMHPPKEEPITVELSERQFDTLNDILDIHSHALNFLPPSSETTQEAVINGEIHEEMMRAYIRSCRMKHPARDENRSRSSYEYEEDSWIIRDPRIRRVLRDNGYDVWGNHRLWHYTNCKIPCNGSRTFPDGSIIKSVGTELFLERYARGWD